MKTISFQLDDKLDQQLDEVCRRLGYKKNTLLTQLIASFIRHQKQKPSVKARKGRDPFDEAIGLLNVESFLSSEKALDKAVYDLQPATPSCQ